jgi:hypothetical protein
MSTPKQNNEKNEPLKAFAEWNLNLTCDCPHCDENVDLLEAPDFWDGQSFGPIDHGTKETTDVGLMCPECRGIILATLQW